MIRIGMCPDPFFQTEWHKIANPNLVWQAQATEAQGGKIIPLTRAQAQHPATWKELNLDVVHYHWPAAAFNFYVARKPVQIVTPHFLVQQWTKFRLGLWEKEVKKYNIPIVWQVHDILSHHAVGYNLAADILLHRAIFSISDGLVLNGLGSLQAVESFYGKVDQYTAFPLGSYYELYGKPIPKTDAKKLLGIENTGKVFSYLGTARPNRNPAATVKAFIETATEDDILIVAGNDIHLYISEQQDPRIMLFPGVISKEKFHKILCASDFIINDGKKYLTSAILRVAADYFVPVITYSYGCAQDYSKDAAIWIDDINGGLPAAIRKAIEMSTTEWQKLSDAARINTESLTWEAGAINCMALYKKVIELRKG